MQDHGTSVTNVDFLKVLAIYGHGHQLGHVTKTIFINSCHPFPRRRQLKFGQAVSEKKMFENNGHIHEYSPKAGAENALGVKICLRTNPSVS